MSAELIALHTGLIPDIAKIIDDYQKLYIYQIIRENFKYYYSDRGSYIDFIVIGDSEEFVKYVHPNGSIINPERGIMQFPEDCGIYEYDSTIHGNVKEDHDKYVKHIMEDLYRQWPNSLWKLPENVRPYKIIIKLIGQAIGDYQNGQILNTTYYEKEW